MIFDFYLFIYLFIPLTIRSFYSFLTSEPIQSIQTSWSRGS